MVMVMVIEKAERSTWRALCGQQSKLLLVDVNAD